MAHAVEMKRVLMRYKQVLRPTIGRLGAVSLDDLGINARLLGVQPLPANTGSKARLRKQISQRMRALGMGSILCLQRGELIALHAQLLAFARAMGGPPGNRADPRWLPLDITNIAAPPLGLGN